MIDRWLRIMLTLNGRYSPDPEGREAFAFAGVLALLSTSLVILACLLRGC